MRKAFIPAGRAVAAVLLAAVALGAQARHPVSGRVIASVMGVGGAAWLDAPNATPRSRRRGRWRPSTCDRA